MEVNDMTVSNFVGPVEGVDATEPTSVHLRDRPAKRLKRREVGHVTCHEDEVDDLFSEGETT